jgi:hypothetical protein
MKRFFRRQLRRPFRRLRQLSLISLLLLYGVVSFRAGFAAHENDLTRPAFEMIFGISDGPQVVLIELLFGNQNEQLERGEKSFKRCRR